jgi:hypothetical protein
MTQTGQWLLLVACGAVYLGGCLPDEMPAYTNGGKTVVAKAEDVNGEAMLWTYDIEKKTATPHPAADGWELYAARMFGDQVWVGWRRSQTGDPSCKRFDPVKNEFVSGPPELEGQDWIRTAIPASYQGRKCLLGMGKDRDEAWSFPELKKLAITDSGLPAGGFWWVQSTAKWEKGRFVEVERIDLLNPEAQRVCSIPAEELGKASPGKSWPARYARLSTDGKTLALFFAKDTNSGIYTLGVFDSGNGKFLWGDKARYRLTGTPSLKPTELWTVEQEWITQDVPATADSSKPSSRPAIALVRYAPGKEPDIQTASREVVLIYPVAPDHSGGQFNPSPDGSHFVMVVNGKPSRLLFIPLKQGITEKDVQVVELADQK